MQFDVFHRWEMPVLTLAYPQGKELGQIGAYINLNGDLNFNAVSEFTFEYPYKDSAGVHSLFYNELQSHMMIKAGELGNFLVTKCSEENNGIKRHKTVTITSGEIELNSRKINVFDGTYKFYDDLNPEDTLLGTLVKYIPHWHIGYVSPELWNKYRTFEVPDSTLYSFIMEDVAETYECIFIFDTINKSINAYSLSDALKKSDLFVSYENLIKTESIEEVSDEFTTALSCYGGDGVNIAGVNPLGGFTIYNFQHVKAWMTDSLKTAIGNWEALAAASEPGYQAKLLELRGINTAIVALKASIADKQGQYNAKKSVQAVRIEGGTAKGEDYNTLVYEMNVLSADISSLKSQLEAKENEAAAKQAELKAISDELKFVSGTSCGFTANDIVELGCFIHEATHQDDRFIKTDIMTLVEIQDMEQQLYEQSERLLSQISQPTYSISVDSTNFVFLPEFQGLIENTGGTLCPEIAKKLLGTCFNLEIAEEEYISPVLLSIHINFSDPTDFSMTFANRYRLNDTAWQFSDLFGDAVSASNNMSFDYSGIKNWESYKNDLVNFANSSLDMTRNSLVNNAGDVTMQFDRTGLVGRSSVAGNQRAIWLTNNVLAFSDDNFATVKTAIGLIPLTENTNAYGVNAEILVGKAIFGSQLQIANEANTMVMDAGGLTITAPNNRIILSPTNGIQIQKNAGSTWTNQMYVDANGDLELVGKITATSGTIGGFNITGTSISSANGNIVLNNDGTGKLGLLTWTANTATFRGNIYATNLVDQIKTVNIASGAVDTSQLASEAITTSKISSDAVTPDKLDRTYASEAYVDNLVANYATISQLNAVSAKVGYLSADGGSFSGRLTASITYANYIRTGALSIPSGGDFIFFGRNVRWGSINSIPCLVEDS